MLCNTCNSFPCKVGAKSDAEVCCVRDAHAADRDALDARAARDDCSPTARPKVEAVEVERNGETFRVEAPRRRRACGAVNSAALLLRSANDAHPDGLANSSGLVGRRYMAHLATMMQGFHPFRQNDDRVSEDRRDQRFLSARAATRRIRSDRSSRRGGRTA